MTTIALFGATGKVGGRVLTRALATGYTVRALVRDPAKLQTSSPVLTVIRGDVLNSAAVANTVAGTDAVLSLFGHVNDSPRTLQTDGTRLIVEAMSEQGVSRIVTLSGGGLPAPPDRPGPSDRIIRLLLKTFSPHVLADAQGHLEVLEDSQSDWTVVRGPRLRDTPGTGSYRVGWVGVNASTQVSRDDIADFILTQIDDRAFVHQMPFVSR